MKKPVPFGKYLLLERVNVGGMAEVFKAKAFGVEGFERLVAVKRILPSIAEDQEFIDMFIDEAKIAVQLTHANIAQIFDLGKHQESYFIAMEFVAGKDLRTIFDRCKKKGEAIPVPMVCYAVMKVCEGLDYAHNKRDSAGREMNIVHRDVSPQNLLVSYDGEVKVIDFGIAKAANKMGRTQAGILKGKFGYMSPEQVRGANLDRRSDVFAMGIVLYELLTGERLFTGESDFSTLEKVRHVDILPPTSFNNKIPPELERIVLRALAKDVQERYQTAMDLHDDLQAFMYATGNFFARKDLSAYMRKTFAEEIAKETARDEQYRSLEMPPTEAEAPRPTNKSGAGIKAQPGGSGVAVKAQTPKAAAGPSAPGGGMDMEWDDEELATQIYDRPDGEGPAPAPSLRSSAPRTSSPGTPPPLAPPPLRNAPGRTLQGPGSPGAPPLPPRASNPRISAPPLPPPNAGRSSKPVSLPPPPDADVVATPMASPRSELSREPTSVTRAQPERSMMPMAIAGLVLVGLLAGAAFFFLGPKDPGTIHLETDPPDTVVVFDGEVVPGSSSPFVISDVEANTPHLIEVRKPGFLPWHQQITVRPSQALSLPKVTLRSRDSGGPRSVDVTFNSTPEGAMVFLVRGRERRYVGPAPVTHTVNLQGDPWTVEMTSTGYEPWRGPLAVPANETTATLSATLRQADGRAAQPQVERVAQAATDRLNQNSPQTPSTPAQTQTPTPTRTPATTTASNPTPTPTETAMTVAPPPQPVTGTGPGTLRLNSIPWSQVYVDGRLVGNTPQMNISLAPGPHRITLVNAEVNVREVHTVTIEPGQTVTRVIRLNVPDAPAPTP